MGPPACAFIDEGVATVHFDGFDSWVLGSDICWGKPVEEDNCEWTFPGGTPAGSYVGSLDVTWDTAGTYMVSLLAKADNGQTTLGYRPVFIFDRTGSGAPYTSFEIRNLRGDLSSGGWSFDTSVFGDADEEEFPAGTLVVVFSESWYGSSEKDFGMNHPGRHNIRAVGWIVAESIKKDPESGEVRFSCQSVPGLMKSRENFSVALNYVSGSPTTWYELKEMDWDRAIFHYLYWHSTVCKMTDVRVSGELHPTFLGPFKIKFQDFPLGSLWNGVAKLCDDCFLVAAGDRASCIYFDYAPCFLSAAKRNDVPTVMALGHQDWTGELEIRRIDEKPVNYVDFEGIAFDGTTVTPLIAYAPGRAPEYMGSPRPKKRCVLDPIAPQTRANVRAGYQLAKDNNEFPEIKFSCLGDYSVADIAPREWLTLTLAAEDTKRGLVWNPRRLLVRSVEERYDHRTGDCQMQFTLEAETSGPPGVTGDYPPEEPPAPPPAPPPIPVPPVPQPGWTKYVYLQTDNKGVFYTEDFVIAPDNIGGVPTWATVNTGLNLAFGARGFRGDSFNPAKYQYSLMEDALYRRTDAGNWVSKLTLAQACTLVGTDQPDNCEFGEDGLTCNINKDGYVAVIFRGNHSTVGLSKVALIYSDDHGDTWDYHLVVQSSAIASRRPFSLVVGAYKGSSPYAAGTVIYVGVEFGGHVNIYVSVDDGVTWSYWEHGLGIFRHDIMVDPNDQSRVFIGGKDLYEVWVSTDHGQAYTKYDANASGDLGEPRSYYHLSVCVDSYKTVRVGSTDTSQFIHRTRTDGADWLETTPQYRPKDLKISLLQASPDLLYLLAADDGVAADGYHTIWASDNEGEVMVPKSGANCHIMDTGGGDSIPYNHGGIRGILQLEAV